MMLKTLWHKICYIGNWPGLDIKEKVQNIGEEIYLLWENDKLSILSMTLSFISILCYLSILFFNF